jgi:hypothetical protein
VHIFPRVPRDIPCDEENVREIGKIMTGGRTGNPHKSTYNIIRYNTKYYT